MAKRSEGARTRPRAGSEAGRDRRRVLRARSRRTRLGTSSTGGRSRHLAPRGISREAAALPAGDVPVHPRRAADEGRRGGRRARRSKGSSRSRTACRRSGPGGSAPTSCSRAHRSPRRRSASSAPARSRSCRPSRCSRARDWARRSSCCSPGSSTRRSRRRCRSQPAPRERHPARAQRLDRHRHPGDDDDRDRVPARHADRLRHHPRGLARRLRPARVGQARRGARHALGSDRRLRLDQRARLVAVPDRPRRDPGLVQPDRSGAAAREQRRDRVEARRVAEAPVDDVLPRLHRRDAHALGVGRAHGARAARRQGVHQARGGAPVHHGRQHHDARRHAGGRDAAADPRRGAGRARRGDRRHDRLAADPRASSTSPCSARCCASTTSSWRATGGSRSSSARCSWRRSRCSRRGSSTRPHDPAGRGGRRTLRR